MHNHFEWSAHRLLGEFNWHFLSDSFQFVGPIFALRKLFLYLKRDDEDVSGIININGMMCVMEFLNPLISPNINRCRHIYLFNPEICR